MFDSLLLFGSVVYAYLVSPSLFPNFFTFSAFGKGDPSSFLVTKGFGDSPGITGLSLL